MSKKGLDKMQKQGAPSGRLVFKKSLEGGKEIELQFEMQSQKKWQQILENMGELCFDWSQDQQSFPDSHHLDREAS